MSDEAELIVDCAAAPDDDRPRLVYADFLQQRGDPRGDFIALQCAYEVARAADDDSLSVKLAKRWRKLLDEHEVQWGAGAWSVLPRSMKFRRGFIEHALLDDAEELGNVTTQLRPYAPLLRAIDLQRGLGALGRHPSLSVIDEVVAHNVIDLADLQALARAAGWSGLRMLADAAQPPAPEPRHHGSAGQLARELQAPRTAGPPRSPRQPARARRGRAVREPACGQPPQAEAVGQPAVASRQECDPRYAARRSAPRVRALGPVAEAPLVAGVGDPIAHVGNMRRPGERAVERGLSAEEVRTAGIVDGVVFFVCVFGV